MLNPGDLTELITTVGYAGIAGIVFAESGILVGAFLPGDSLLFTAGFLASQGLFDITILVAIIFLAAVTGDSVGYAFGHRVGKKLFKREDSLLFHRRNLIKTQAFYERHGAKTIVLARFFPVIRTFAPILAGVGNMNYRVFLMYNILGGALWSFSLTVGGYYLGRVIPDVDRYLLPIIAAIVVVSLIPSLIHVLRQRTEKQEEEMEGVS